MSFLNEVHDSFRRGTMLKKLLYINVAVFLIARICVIVSRLLATDMAGWIAQLELPSDPYTLLTHPWTLFTYMFMHYEVMHLLFNMICLFGFGQLFLTMFSQKQLLGLYIIGGLAGAAVYVASYNIFPFFAPVRQNGLLLGASASIMAIIVAVAAYSPNYSVPLFLIGQLRLKYVALLTVGISMLGIASDNAGGELAHLGGALAGFIFARRLLAGKDITKWFNHLADRFISFFKRKPVKFRVSYTRPKNDETYRNEKRADETEINRILDKIKQSGYSSLTGEEKKKLFDKSKQS
jgi:membrane associated rhomboid family serine protease